MVRAVTPRGAPASPPCVRPVCRRGGTLRGRIAHATLFSGTRPRCRTRQEWKYTGTRDGRLTHWSALARFGVPEMHPYGRVAHYMDTSPEVTSFTLVGRNRGHLARRDCPGGGTGRRPTRGIPPLGYRRDRAASMRREPPVSIRDPGRRRRLRVNRRLRQCEAPGDGSARVSRHANASVDRIDIHTRLVASASIPSRTKMPKSA